MGVKAEALYGWETVHRSDAQRKIRKRIQLSVDLVTFVISGGLALITFIWLMQDVSRPMWGVVILDAVLLLLLTWRILVYADTGN